MLSTIYTRTLQSSSRVLSRQYLTRTAKIGRPFPSKKENVEQFCYKTDLADCVVLESTNTDWSLVISNRTIGKDNGCGSNFVTQLFVKLLSANPLTTSIMSTQQGSLTGILKKEIVEKQLSNKYSPNFSQLCLKFTESDSKMWKIICSNVSVAKAFEDSLSNFDHFKSNFQVTCFSSPSSNSSSNQVEIRMPKACFAKQNINSTVAMLTKILSHPRMLPFVTSTPTLSEMVSSPTVEMLCL